VGSTAANDELLARVQASNLDPETMLATDYLNHFNEVVMLLEMIPDMPEMMEEVQAWKPKSYVQHFLDSSIADREIAVDAYGFVDPKYRGPFDQTIEQLNSAVMVTIDRLAAYIEQNNEELLREQAKMMAQMIQRLMDTASGIIHGGTETMAQGEIDAVISS